MGRELVWVWVGGSFSRGSFRTPATTSPTSGPPFYPKEGLVLLSGFSSGSSGMEAVVIAAVRQKLLRGTGKKWDLTADMAASPLPLSGPSHYS